jgi:hypothetical protein
MIARCEVQDFIWLVTLPVVDIMEHEYNWIELSTRKYIIARSFSRDTQHYKPEDHNLSFKQPTWMLLVFS